MPVTVLLLMSALALVACTSSPPALTDTSLPSTSTTTSVPTTSDPEVVWIETPLGGGSGLHLTPGRVVTNAHVVWPYREVSVRLRDGEGLRQAEVVAVDGLADLAVVDVSGGEGFPPSVALVTDLPPPGTPLRLMGYSVEREPTLRITSATAGEIRRWPAAGFDYLEVNAPTLQGQSGGAVVDGEGRLVGIAGLGLQGGPALALSAVQLSQRVAQLEAGGDPAGLGPRWLDELLVPASEVVLPHPLAEGVFVLDAEKGGPVELVLAGDPVEAVVVAPDGLVEASLADSTRTSTLTFTPQVSAPHFLALIPLLLREVTVTVHGVEGLQLLQDPDHGVELSPGDAYHGYADYPGDVDWFRLDLEAGESVTINVSSTSMDPALVIDWLQDRPSRLALRDSDSGGGVVGGDAKLRFTAPADGSYLVAVVDETQFGPGGFVLEVQP